MSFREEKLRNELREAVELSNKIISFHDEVIEYKTRQVEALEKENRNLSQLVLHASDLLKLLLLSSERYMVH